VNGTLSACGRLLQRELLLAMRRKSDALTTLVFFVIVVSLFPLGVGADPKLLHSMAAGVVWVAALLASMLALNRLFANDQADGTLEQMILSPAVPTALVLTKITAHWLVTGLPLVLVAPVLGFQYDLGGDELAILALGLLLGTPTLSLLGAIGAALTLGVRGGGVLVSLLVLPLNVPILIFGAGAVEASASGIGASGNFSLLGAMLIGAVLGGPWVTTLALRIALE
jgi:heme exporter protein B